MKRFQTILATSLLTLAICSTTFAGDITGRKGDITGKNSGGDITGKNSAGDITGRNSAGDITGKVGVGDITGKTGDITGRFAEYLLLALSMVY